MVRKGFNPGSEQGALHFTEANPVNLKERAAVGRLMGSRALSYLGVNIEYLGQVTESDLQAVEVPALMSGLYDQRSGRRISNLAVNETEFIVVVRSAAAFAETVSAKTSRARSIDHNPKRRSSAIERSITHAVEAKEQPFEGVMDWLATENDRLRRLRKELATPHLSHMNDGELRQLASAVWEFSFSNILAVVGHQKDWDNEQLEAAKRAMVYKMTHGKQRQRQMYWLGITDLALQYNRNRRGLFNSKMIQARHRAERAEKQSGDYLR